MEQEIILKMKGLWEVDYDGKSYELVFAPILVNVALDHLDLKACMRDNKKTINPEYLDEVKEVLYNKHDVFLATARTKKDKVCGFIVGKICARSQIRNFDKHLKFTKSNSGLFTHERVGFIVLICSNPKYHVGKQLLDLVMLYLRSKLVHRIGLITAIHHLVPVYERWGFKPVAGTEIEPTVVDEFTTISGNKYMEKG